MLWTYIVVADWDQCRGLLFCWGLCVCVFHFRHIFTCTLSVTIFDQQLGKHDLVAWWPHPPSLQVEIYSAKQTCTIYRMRDCVKASSKVTLSRVSASSCPLFARHLQIYPKKSAMPPVQRFQLNWFGNRACYLCLSSAFTWFVHV